MKLINTYTHGPIPEDYYFIYRAILDLKIAMIRMEELMEGIQ